MAALIGRFEYTLDPKNRVFVPPRFRELLAQEKGAHFILALGPKNYLRLFLPSQWEHFVAKGTSLQFKSQEQKRAALRHLFSTAEEAPLDDQGRILIPQRLKEHAGLRRDVMMLGAGGHAELWDKQALSASERASQKHYAKLSETLDL